MFTRTILQHLEAWRNDPLRKPLVLRGARQVGKTTVVNQFGATFANYLYLNLEDRTIADVFQQHLPLHDIVHLLFARSGKVMQAGDTLLFIDEIQNSPEAIARLRYFYEEMPEIHVIAAGSLLENIVDVQTSFPVGRVQYMAMRPCSFVEFVGALGKSSLLELMRKPEQSVSFHDELMHLFQQYVLVGGMPEIVQRYANNPDIWALDDTYESLVQSYKDDTEKYARRGKLTQVVRFILDRGWAKAGETVTLGRFADSEYQSREVGEAFRLLEKAMLVEMVFPTTSTQVPALPELKRMPKLIWMDTGLVNYQAGARRDILAATDVLDVWKGRIAEQVVAQELLALSHKVSSRRGFWVKGKGEAEVDFIYPYKGQVIPIEVKNGHNAHLRSLHVFMEKAPINVAVRMWAHPFSIDEVTTPTAHKSYKLINLPLYLLHRLEDILAMFI